MSKLWGLGDRNHRQTEGSILHNKKEIKFLSITALYFIKDTTHIGKFMELIDAEVKLDHIVTLKKQLDKAEIIFLS